MEKVFPPCAPDAFLPYTEEILNYQAPGAPRIHSVPLPLLASAVTSPHNREASDIYPLEIRSSLPFAKKIELQTIVLTPPVHIHTPHAHIGTIFGNTPGERLYALDIFSQLQAMISQKLDYHMTYSQLPSTMKIEVEAAFMRRRGQSLDAVTSWREFLSGRPSPAGPISYDLLLGHHAIWGFESYCIGGYSVVHLA